MFQMMIMMKLRWWWERFRGLWISSCERLDNDRGWMFKIYKFYSQKDFPLVPVRWREFGRGVEAVYYYDSFPSHSTFERGTCNAWLFGRHKYIFFQQWWVCLHTWYSFATDKGGIINTNTIHKVILYASFWAPREFCEILFLILTVLFLVLILMVLVYWDVQLMASWCSTSPSTPSLSSQGRQMGSFPTTLCRRKVTLSTADSS